MDFGDDDEKRAIFNVTDNDELGNKIGNKIGFVLMALQSLTG